jgi:flagellar hook-associated protein 3 FlgL
MNYLSQLEQTQNNKFKEEVRLTTGKRITGIEEEPERLSEIKIIQSKISKNEGFRNIIEQTLAEMRVTSESMDFMSNTLKSIRQAAIDSIGSASSGNINVYSEQIKSLLEDLIGQANSEFNGKPLYSGTSTTSNSLTVDPAYAAYSNSALPFELINIPPTSDNPSGLKVIFKGNNNDRLVNKDSNTTEVTNVKSKDLFGENLELLENIIKIYNKISYNSDGILRDENSHLSSAEIDEIDILQKSLYEHDEKLTNTIALFGSKYNRLDNLSQQMIYENINLKEILSAKSDTDIAKTVIDLKMEETALQYSLQVGARIMQNSLFDFLK